MDWIQENKFVSGLLAATILFAGGIFYHGYSEGDDFKANMAQYARSQKQIRHLDFCKAVSQPSKI